MDISVDHMEQFLDLACRLSPENLACDGEISKAETNRRYRQCMKEWRALEKEAGRKMSEEEVWNWSIKKRA